MTTPAYKNMTTPANYDKCLPAPLKYLPHKYHKCMAANYDKFLPAPLKYLPVPLKNITAQQLTADQEFRAAQERGNPTAAVTTTFQTAADTSTAAAQAAFELIAFGTVANRTAQATTRDAMYAPVAIAAVQWLLQAIPRAVDLAQAAAEAAGHDAAIAHSLDVRHVTGTTGVVRSARARRLGHAA
ncbi:hypothetical protein V7S43_008003 [Phytophthora oleae]|uniref:Uncharacterized protein n=1 Tax=Phytophthora oleae TaxID=2107226 RepID=A0ABD3FMU5_9STRA